jgi:LysM repeat protein
VQRGRREELARYAAPAAFLVGMTILVLIVSSALNGGRSTASAPTTVPVSTAAATTSATGTTPPVTSPTTPQKQYYAIQSGDTFGTVAARFSTTVEALQALNPGVSSNSLTVGEKIRVK